MPKEEKTAYVIYPKQTEEAMASIKLYGDTMDCEKCKANIRQQLIEEIEKHSTMKESLISDIPYRFMAESWWQQFKDKEE